MADSVKDALAKAANDKGAAKPENAKPENATNEKGKNVTTPAPVKNENANAENADKRTDAELENDLKKVAFTVPDSFDKFKARFPKTAALIGDANPILVLMGQLYDRIDEVSTLMGKISASKREVEPKEVIQFASAIKDGSETQLLYVAYEEARKAMEEAEKALIDSTLPKMKENALDEEGLKKAEEDRRTGVDVINSFKTSITELPKTGFVSPDELEDLNKVLAEIKAPGSRGKGSVKATGASKSGIRRIRLNDGYVSVNGTQYGDFLKAAKKIEEMTNSPMTKDDLIDKWVDASGVGDNWRDIPENKEIEFRLNSGTETPITVKVMKLSAPTK